MTKNEFINEVEQIIGAVPGTIKGQESLKELEGWDSMATVAFMAMADERLKQEVSPHQLAECKTVSDLIGLFPGKIQ